MISQQSQYELPQVAYVIGGIHVMEWSRGHSDYLADPSGIPILNWAQTFRLFYRDATGNDRIWCMMIDMKRLFAQVEYEIGWDRPDIKSTALAWRFFWEAVEDPRRRSCVVLDVYINLLRLILMMMIRWHGRRQVSVDTRSTEWCDVMPTDFFI